MSKRVRPLLIERCYKCHSEAKKVNGGLRLDSRRGWIEGGDSGPAISPGKPEDSLLIKAVRYRRRGSANAAGWEVGCRRDCRARRMGAHRRPRSAGSDPAGSEKPDVDPAAARAHWAYQPLQQIAPPAVRDGQWPLGNVDRFVLAKLEARGLHPSLDADRYLWLRRVSLDLTGLPPTSK